MTVRFSRTKLLAHAGRLLLEYNESTGEIHRALTQTSHALTGEECRVWVSYRGVSVSFDGEAQTFEPVRELRYNTALQAQVHSILEQIRDRTLEPQAALAALDNVEAGTPRHPRWLAVVLLGAAAAALAHILGADDGAIAVSGISSALGLFVRQELGRRHASLLVLPLAASLIGALLGGLVIRLGWTRTPGLAVVVPSLMLVPGPHLINGLFDLIDNFLPMSLARLGLATGILLSSALGIVIGLQLTMQDLPTDGATRTEHLNVVTDMLLAAVVTCGFAVFYNTPWRYVAMAAAGGMAGHGLRFLALKAGNHLEVATFLGGFAVGVTSAWLSRSGRLPVAVIAFAGAVTMMPGTAMFRALGGALQLSWQMGRIDPADMAATLGNALQATLVVGGLALGLIFGARARC